MNKQNILALAAFLSDLPQRAPGSFNGRVFDYSTGYTIRRGASGELCGTACCIGGWAREALSGEVEIRGSTIEIDPQRVSAELSLALSDFTGLEPDVCYFLCYCLAGAVDVSDLCYVTKEHAVKVLHLIVEEELTDVEELDLRLKGIVF